MRKRKSNKRKRILKTSKNKNRRNKARKMKIKKTARAQNRPLVLKLFPYAQAALTTMLLTSEAEIPSGGLIVIPNPTGQLLMCILCTPIFQDLML